MQRSYTKIDNEHMKQIIEAQPRKTSWGDAYYLLVNMCTFPKRTKKIKNQIITLQQNEAAVAQSVMKSDWGWTTQEVRSFLSYLDKNGIFSMRKVKSKGGKVICTIFKPKGIYSMIEAMNNNSVKDNSQVSKQGFVYLMLDNNTGYYKIGFSKNPKYRERTLQSEKPTIVLINKFKGSAKQEKALHQLFRHKRIRGEWFSLNQSDIALIEQYFTHN